MRAVAVFGLCVALAACSPARGEPVGVSQGGKDDVWVKDAAAPVKAPPLAGLPSDFRTSLHRVGRIATSEHQNGVSAILWADDAGQLALARGSAVAEKAIFVEEILGPAAADGGTTTTAIYLLSTEGSNARFGVADPRGMTVQDDEGTGGSLCARCHAEAPRAPMWVTRPN